MNRRDFTKLIAAAAGTAALFRPSQTARAAAKDSPDSVPQAGGPWKLSLSEISTLNAPFAEDVRAYAAAGFDAIGLWEFKLPNDDGAVGEALHQSGLAVANCVPAVPSILPWDLPGMEGPRDSQERIDHLCASMGRLAKFDPASVLVISGPMGKFPADKARAIVIDGLRQIGAAARSAKIPLGLEPINPIQHDTTSFVNSLAGAMDLLKEANVEGLGIMADTYNLWNENPADLAAIARHVKGLHVADMPVAAQRTDRLLPLEGGTRTAALVSALIGAGWRGIIDIEIFSTPDRFWGLPVDEAARRAHAADVSLREKLNA